MEREKIKEIKETLEHNAYFAIEYFPKAGKPKVFKLDDILNFINELESENERLNEYIKGNEADAKAFVNGWHKDLRKELELFVERLKEKVYHEARICRDIVDVQSIDEILKEFIKDES